jgi:WD40 repeat protein/MinD-like ATPase involved in chromosome partitioning or flagellar assembly
MSAPRIVTFYSYKGGTGRSMALANVAWILAMSGKRVLAIDWDLEAPGLHRYFHPFLEDKELARSEGLIDFVMQYAETAVTRTKTKRTKDWYKPYANILRYASSLDFPFPGKATIDFVPAGRQGADYATRVNAFNWQHFYERLSGGVMLEAAKLSMSPYDCVLIDSRTGVSDTSGICTVQMPDTLVVCFTLNTQSIEGAAAVAESADAQRRNAKGKPTLRILPVPTRVESTERSKLDAGMAAARKRFDGLLWHLDGKIEEYWARAAVQYQPFYAFEEILAVFGDTPGNPQSMLASMESLAGWVDGSKEPLRLPETASAEREAMLSRYLRTQAAESLYILRRITGHKGPVKALAISEDGKLAFSGAENEQGAVWDLETGERRGIPGSTPWIRYLAVRGDHLLSIRAGGWIEDWSLTSETFAFSEQLDEGASSLAATPDREYVLVGTEKGTVWRRDGKSGAYQKVGSHNGPVWGLAVSSDGNYAVSASFDRILIRWQIGAALAPLMTYSGHTAEVTSVSISGDDSLIMSGSYDATLRLWDTKTAALLRTFQGHSGRIYDVAFSPDARLAASASADKMVHIWDVASGRLLLQLAAHSAAVNAVDFMPDGRRVVSASDDGTLIVWNVEQAYTHLSPPAGIAVAAPVRLRSAEDRPLVYLSYSRRDRDRYFVQFIQDLEQALRTESGEAGELVIWWDDNLHEGDDLPGDIATALRSARVAVCMTSPAYFERVYTGKEFTIFQQRMRGEGGIYPIIWLPARWPEAIAGMEPSAVDLAVYRDEGLAYAMRLSRHRLAYERLVHQFAHELVQMARRTPLTAVGELPPLKQIPNAFGGRDTAPKAAGPARVLFSINSHTQFGKSLWSIAQEVAVECDMPSGRANWLEIQHSRTAYSNNVVIVIEDDKNGSKAAEALAGRPNYALVVINTSEKLEHPPRPPRDIGYFAANILSEAALRDALRNAIVKIRHALIAQSTGGELSETPVLPSTT